jgi:uncharacterized protein
MSSYSLSLPAHHTVTSQQVFTGAVAAVVVHIADAELVRPEPGTSARDHLAAALVPAAMALAGAAVFARLRPGLRAAVAAVFGSLTLVAGLIALGGGVERADWTGLLLLPAAAALLALAAWIPWRARGTGRWRNRAIAIVLTPLVAFFVVVPIGAALWTTQKFRTPIGTFSVPHEDVMFRTSDGLDLSGWYVPSRNGAAVVIVHGGGGSRDGAKRHAALLAHAGYGVLLYDARGRGESEGATDAYGWTWGRDVDAAIEFVKHRGVHRIGALGLSTGADVLIEVAAQRHDLRAVVADGSTSRSFADTRRISHGGDVLTLPFWATQYAAASVLEGARPGKPLEELAAHVAPTKFLFIASTWQVERRAAPLYAAAAHAQLWRVDAGHTAGLREHPEQYARHVLGFYERTLLR